MKLRREDWAWGVAIATAGIVFAVMVAAAALILSHEKQERASGDDRDVLPVDVGVGVTGVRSGLVDVALRSEVGVNVNVRGVPGVRVSTRLGVLKGVIHEVPPLLLEVSPIGVLDEASTSGLDSVEQLVEPVISHISSIDGTLNTVEERGVVEAPRIPVMVVGDVDVPVDTGLGGP